MLITALQNEDSNVRKVAARELGKLGDPRATEPLVAILKEHAKNWRELYHVQKLSIKSLVKLGEPAVKPLIAALQDVDNDVRWMAAKALRQIKNPQAVRSLIAALQDDDFLVSTAAAEALKKIGTPKALAALEEYERNNRR